MSAAARLLGALAVLFAVAGDYWLKVYGDTRMVRALLLCLCLWEACAAAWVFCYRQHVSIAIATGWGAALTLIGNCLLARFVFAESLTATQWFGMVLVLIGVAVSA